jgi:hypothetical protein
MPENDPLLYREEQRIKHFWWIWLLIGPISALFWYGFVQQIIFGVPFGSKSAPNIVIYMSWLIAGIGLPLLFYSLRMIVEIRRSTLYIRFIPFRTRKIPISKVVHIEPSVYRAFHEYGGWGIKMGNDGWVAYTVSGNQGVKLVLANGEKLLIGLQHPTDFIDAFSKNTTATQ